MSKPCSLVNHRDEVPTKEDKHRYLWQQTVASDSQFPYLLYRLVFKVLLWSFLGCSHGLHPRHGEFYQPLNDFQNALSNAAIHTDLRGWVGGLQPGRQHTSARWRTPAWFPSACGQWGQTVNTAAGSEINPKCVWHNPLTIFIHGPHMVEAFIRFQLKFIFYACKIH